MKKKSCFSVMLVFLYFTAGSQGISFETGSWEEVKAKASRLAKPIFVDAYTDWCGPCKVMSAKVFTNDSVGRYFNNTFINYKMDMEKGEGIAFAQMHEVNAFPTLLYFDKDAHMTFKSVGAKTAAGLLEQARLSFDPEFQLETYRKRYQSSKKTLRDLSAFAGKLKMTGNYRELTETVNNHFHSMPEQDMLTTEAWKVITEFVYNYESPVFRAVLANRNKYGGIIGVSKVNEYIFNVLTSPRIIISPARNAGNEGKEDLARYIKTLAGYKKYVDLDYFVSRMQYLAYINREDSAYFYARKYFDGSATPLKEDDKLPYFLTYMSNKYIDESGDKFQSAVKWVEKARTLQPEDYKSAYVYAQILRRQGKRNIALAEAEKALRLYRLSTDAPVVKRLFKGDTIESFISELNTKTN